MQREAMSGPNISSAAAGGASSKMQGGMIRFGHGAHGAHKGGNSVWGAAYGTARFTAMVLLLGTAAILAGMFSLGRSHQPDTAGPRPARGQSIPLAFHPIQATEVGQLKGTPWNPSGRVEDLRDPGRCAVHRLRRRLRRELTGVLNEWTARGEVSPTEGTLLACSWGLHSGQLGVNPTSTIDMIGSESNRTQREGIPRPEARRGQAASVTAPETSQRRPLRVVPYHLAFGRPAHAGYHEDGAERLARGYNEVHPVHDGSESDPPQGPNVGPVDADGLHKPTANRSVDGNFVGRDQGGGKSLFTVVSTLADADAVVYHAYGDSRALHADVARANTADGPAGCIPVVFYLTTDGDYAPTECRGRLVFFAVNASTRSGCEVLAIPNQEGAAMNGVDVTLRGILRRVHPSGIVSNRTLVASFMGSMYTHPTRHKMEVMRGDDIKITATDWWLRNGTANVSAAAEVRRHLASLAFSTAEESVFQLTPRGNGPSSMRLVEAMAAGAVPVMMDDWTEPFGDPMCGFALRWPTRPSNPRLDLLQMLLRDLARDAAAITRRRDAMARFLRNHHPAWFDTRFVHSRVLHGRTDLCGTRRLEKHALPS